MNKGISINLSAIGFDKRYSLYIDGTIIDTTAAANIAISSKNEVRLMDKDGKKRRIRLKKLYRQAFNREYCIDDIENLYGERWKPVSGTNGRYYISDCGRLKSYCGYSARLIKPYCNQHNYLRADIWREGKRETALIHRLVAEAFIENDKPKEKDTIDHIDGKKKNNAASNLRWLSRSDNAKAYYAALPKAM